MSEKSWTEGEVIKISKDRNKVIDHLLDVLSKKSDIIFGARLGFGVPNIDFVTVDIYRNLVGYVLSFPVINRKINTMPYYQNFGESIFLPDQMLDGSYLIVPDIEIEDNNPFTTSPNPIYRLRREAYSSGISLFDRNYNITVFKEAKGSLAKQFKMLKLELLLSIIDYGEIVINQAKEEEFKKWLAWVKEDVESLGRTRILDEKNARIIAKKILQDLNYHSVEFSVSQGQIEAKPKPIEIFEVRGRGFYLGDEKEFSFKLSRISGKILGGGIQ